MSATLPQAPARSSIRPAPRPSSTMQSLAAIMLIVAGSLVASSGKSIAQKIGSAKRSLSLIMAVAWFSLRLVAAVAAATVAVVGIEPCCVRFQTMSSRIAEFVVRRCIY